MNERYNDVESEFDDSYKSELNGSSAEDDFGIAITSASLAVSNLDEIRRLLAERIYELLHSDFNRLKSALYMMDIDEEKAEEALRETSFQACAVRLADAVIERKMEMLRFRNL